MNILNTESTRLLFAYRDAERHAERAALAYLRSADAGIPWEQLGMLRLVSEHAHHRAERLRHAYRSALLAG